VNPMSTTGYKDIDHILMCNWYNSTSGTWACFPSDGFTWQPRSVVLLNALPLNAFNSRVRVDIAPVNTAALLDILSKIPLHSYRCFIGHPATAALINKYIPVKCIRDVYKFAPGDDLLIAFVLKSRPNVGADVNVDVSDLLSYVIIPSPILDNA